MTEEVAVENQTPVTKNEEKETVAQETIEVEKSEDKKDIEDEEREKMLNEENKKEIGEVEKKKKALEEAAEREGTRMRIPTGGIKIPGFLRSRSRDKNKVRFFINIPATCLPWLTIFILSCIFHIL